jgi:hypothetical protein
VSELRDMFQSVDLVEPSLTMPVRIAGRVEELEGLPHRPDVRRPLRWAVTIAVAAAVLLVLALAAHSRSSAPAPAKPAPPQTSEIAVPQSRRVVLNQTQRRYGVSISVLTVDYTLNDTRVFVSVRNNGLTPDVKFDERDAWAIQHGHRYNSTFFETTYPKVSPVIPMATTSSGVVAFSFMDWHVPTRLFMVASSKRNPKLDDSPYVFNVPGE